ncbi:MAG: L,D-transpeptidase [Planctomycetes bacterium]|nr:L,D-transpeptidase [Planctomycetota bacterium]
MHRSTSHRLDSLAGLLLALTSAGCGSGEESTGASSAEFVRLEEVHAAESAPSSAGSTPSASEAAPTAAELSEVGLRPEASSSPQPSGVPDLSNGDRAAQTAPHPLDAGAHEAEAIAAIEAKEGARAARILSDVILGHLREGGDDRVRLARWCALLAQAQSLHRWSKSGAWRSTDLKVKSGDSLIALRKRALSEHPEALVCTGQIARVNGLASETAIRPDDTIRVPLERASMLVDLSAMWAFYCYADELVVGWEIGVGKSGSDTRPGVYTIGLKQENPMWSPVGRDPVPFGDPANPLGTRWLAWYQDGRGTTLGFHGTNDPTSVGKRVSEGCIRMRNEDVEALFEILPKDAEVRVQP